MSTQQSALQAPLAFDVPRALGFVVLALIAAVISKSLALPAGHCVAMSLFNGVLLATYLLSPTRTWLRWSALAFVMALVVDAGIQRAPAPIALADGLGHVAGMLLAAWAISRYHTLPFSLQTPREVLLLSMFLAVGAVVGASVEALLSVAGHGASSMLEWLRNWTSGMGGILAAAVILTLYGSAGRSSLWATGRRTEAAALLLALGLVTHAVFSSRLPLAFFLLPLFVWQALRFDIAAMSVGLAVVAGVALHHTGMGMGPYADPANAPDMVAILVQLFVFVAACGCLTLSAVTSQRQSVFEALQQARAELEDRVQARTAALRASEASLRENEERFRLARAAAKIIVVDWDVQHDELLFSDSPQWLRGPLPPSGKYPLYKLQVHPEDREHFLKMRQLAVSTLCGNVVQYRIVRTDGVVLHIETFQTMLAGPDGKAARLVAVQQDITARKQAEIALHESEQRLRALLDTIPDQVRMKDTEGRYLMANRAACEHLGRPESEIVGRTIFELRPRHLAEQIDAVDKAAAAVGGLSRVERPSFYNNDVWREEINAPMRADDGTITGYVSISRDISERKRAETALRESEQRLRTLLDAIPDEVRLKDIDGRYVMLNRAAQLQVGRDEKATLGLTVYDMLPLPIAQRIDQEEKQALAAADPLRVDRTGDRYSGRWREAILAPVRDAAGKVTGLVSISRDITERKAAEMEALRLREEQYRALVEQATDLIYRTDPAGNFTYFNSDAALARIVGYTRQELLGRNYLAYVHPDYRAQADLFYRRQFRNRDAASYYEFPAVSRDGRTVWVGQHVNVVIDDGRILYHQGVCRDITERVMAQTALRESNDRLRRLTARQEELLEAERTKLAHDLHDGIGQAINLARIKLSDLMLHRESASLETAIGELVQIVDETRAVIRTLEFDLSPPVLRELGLEPALEWLAEQMQQDYGLRVSLSRDDEEKPLSQASRAVVFRAVRELLINVARHAGTREAHVDTQCQAGRLVVTVSDEGAGFDIANTAKGLGLAGVQERFAHLGGGVRIASTPGEGTVATLSLPLGAFKEGAAG